jgi:putative ABC transport system permease protein
VTAAARTGDGLAVGPNWALALRLALRSLRRHRVVALATMLGVAIGVTVVGAVLIVDDNTARQPPTVLETGPGGVTPAPSGAPAWLTIPRQPLAPTVRRITFVRGQQAGAGGAGIGGLVPTQRGGVGTSGRSASLATRGAEDYEAMRLAVRLASLLAFLVGGVIVFYTMRFSVAARAREFSLLLCLGESRASVAASLAAEALLLGLAGAAGGLGLAVPAGRAMLALGISTTGQSPVSHDLLPWGELVAMAGLALLVAMAGVIGPARALWRMEIAAVLQPRFIGSDAELGRMHQRGLGWLIPPLLGVAWLLVRPFLASWLNVVHFFLFEAAFIALLAAATLWWVTPLLKGVIRAVEWALRPFLPLETLLAGRRMRVASRQITFAVTGIVLVFSMLTALHDITRALKDEVQGWARVALYPYAFYGRTSMPMNEPMFRTLLAQNGLGFVRMSAKLAGEFPVRLVRRSDVNPSRMSMGRPLLLPGTAILSRTAAARLALGKGDVIVIEAANGTWRFRIVEVADDLGYYDEPGRYVDLKSYIVMSDGNPLFAGNLERTLGFYGAAWSAVRGRPLWHGGRYDALYPFYLRTGLGPVRSVGQTAEIDRDFLIFDFILVMTVALAGIGVVNTMLIQVQARGREFSVLRTLGMSSGQVARLLLAEGLIVGLVGALLAAAVGNALGAVSVSFLDHFTLFDYAFRFSGLATAFFSGLCLFTCTAAALYPSLVATRTSSAESLHYE